jgi:peptidoglycan/xylan/chitin deacetylase (PgdA/CDA1 family)
LEPFLRHFLLRTGMDALAAMRVDRWLAPMARWTGVVLMLHRVRPRPADPFQPNAHLEITPEFLDEVLGRLAQLRIPVVGLDEAAERLRAGDGRFAVLTYDDGYRDNLEVAQPVMARHKVPYTVFVATGMVDGTALPWWLVLEEALRRSETLTVQFPGSPHACDAAGTAAKQRAFAVLSRRISALAEADRRPVVRALADAAGIDVPTLLRAEMMDWDDLRRLAADPLATIGGHTVDHPSLATLPDAEARREIEGGLDRLHRQLGRRPTHFAYPFGSPRDVSERDVRLVESLGLAVAVTTRRGMLRSDGTRAAAWPRMSLNGHFQNRRDFDLLVSGVPFMLDGLRRGRLVGAA